MDIDGVKAFKDWGWVLMRASNTEPLIRMNAEAKSKGKLKEILDLGEKVLTEVIKKYD